MHIFTHAPIINVLAQVLVDPTAATYLALMDEFQKDMSEVGRPPPRPLAADLLNRR